MRKQGWKNALWLSLFVMALGPVAGQFAPAAGIEGSSAIWKDSTIFVEWASGCTVQRGLQSVADTSLGYANVGNDSAVLGPAGQNGIVSLGDGGVATVTFTNPVTNGRGFDFAIFENGFGTGDSNLAFLEFAFVEVSSDGINFFRFPVETQIPDTVQLVMEGIDCTLVNNLAGKYVNGYGTPFDLEEMKDTPGLDVDRITHIRMIDVVGSIDDRYATYDKNGNKVNDPWPTAFGSSGFDLDAVGAMYTANPNPVSEVSISQLPVYPNPVSRGNEVQIVLNRAGASVDILDINGRLLNHLISESSKLSIGTSALSAGVYVIHINDSSTVYNTRLIVQ